MLDVLATSDYLRNGNVAAFRLRVRDVPRPPGAEIILSEVDGTSGAGATAYAPSGTPSAEAERRTSATERPQVSDLIPAKDANGQPSFAVIAPVRGVERSVIYLLRLVVPAAILGELLQREEVLAAMTASIADRQGLVVARNAKTMRYLGLRLPAATLQGMEDRDEGWSAPPRMTGLRWLRPSTARPSQAGP
jgi:hypothetical protein